MVRKPLLVHPPGRRAGFVKTVVNFVAFQAAWFACVLGAANGMPWLGPVVVALVLVLHLALALQPRCELILAAIAALFGLVFDSLLVTLSWLSYDQGMMLPGLAPYWIIAMWIGFATTLNVSMRWMHGRWVLAVIMGAIGGPLAYLAGARFGAVTIVEPVLAMVALAVIWGVAMPLLSYFGTRFDGTVPAVSKSAVSGTPAG